MRALLACTVCFVAVGAGVAQAQRAPTRAESAAIVKAVKTSRLTRGVPSARYDVKKIPRLDGQRQLRGRRRRAQAGVSRPGPASAGRPARRGGRGP